MAEGISYRIVRSNRKTIAIQIAPAGEILVRCPNRMRDAEVRRFVESKRWWIEKQRQRMPPQPPLTEAERQRLILQAKATLPVTVARFAAAMGVTYGRITVRSQRSRWGSCSGRGNLNFNCLLMLVPEQVRDYVVVHELCHRKEMNHSAVFWAEVEKVLPDYRQHRRWLKEHGNGLIARLAAIPAGNPDG